MIVLQLRVLLCTLHLRSMNLGVTALLMKLKLKGFKLVGHVCIVILWIM